MESSVVILIDDLRCAETRKKVNAVQQLDKIASVLGADRTNTELLPYVMDMIDDEDEVLLELAKALGDFLPYIGKKSNLFNVIKPLEALCTVEEGAVRDEATNSIRKLLKGVKPKDFEDDLVKLIKRLVNGDWFTSKVSATNILPSIYPNVSSSAQKDLFKFYSPLCNDSVPQVRKAAAICLNELIKFIPSAPEADLLQIFESLQKDKQDMVKMQGVDSCINFAHVLTESKISTYIVPYLKTYAEDKSWRLRYLVATKILDLAKAIGKDLTKTKLVPHFCNFLSDPESEVRTAASSQLNEFSQLLKKDTIISKIIPTFKKLADDGFTFVRIALAENMLSVCPIIGKSDTNEHIIPIFLQLLRDESAEVRLAVFKKLMNLNEVIGIDSLSQSILPAITELTKDKNWRIRITVIEMFPLLGQQLGETFFDANLCPMMIEWLSDPIYAIRECTINQFKEIGENFGPEWLEKNLFPKLASLESEENYLFRQIPLIAFRELAKCLTKDIYSDSIFPVLSTFATDKIINIRMNVSRVIIEFAGKLKGTDAEDKTISLLNALKNDPEFDVSYYAKQALRKF